MHACGRGILDRPPISLVVKGLGVSVFGIFYPPNFYPAGY